MKTIYAYVVNIYFCNANGRCLVSNSLDCRTLYHILKHETAEKNLNFVDLQRINLLNRYIQNEDVYSEAGDGKFFIPPKMFIYTRPKVLK